MARYRSSCPLAAPWYLSPTYEVTYRWLVVTLGETAIELYPVPMSEEGQENNPLNNTEVLVGLAEDLAPVPSGP